MKKKSRESNAITESVPDGFRCAHCDRVFRRESSLVAHVCEQGRRHLERNEVGVKIGLQAYLRFYEITQGSTRQRGWDDFRVSSYYRAFVAFGRYCQATRVIAAARFTDWLINNNHRIDSWCSDRVYTEFLNEHVRREAATDAMTRAIEQAMLWEQRTGNPAQHYLRHGSANMLCQDITSGRVTAWCLYNSASGRELLDRLNPEQVSLVWPWIDSDFWQQRFRDLPTDTDYVRETLVSMGW